MAYQDKPRNGLEYEARRVAKLFGMPEDVLKGILKSYYDKYSPKGGKLYKATVTWLLLPQNEYRLDGRHPDEFIYDICTGWLKEDMAIAKIKSMLPEGFDCKACGHDTNRVIIIPQGKRPRSDADFEVINLSNNVKVSIQLKGTSYLSPVLRIKKEDMDSNLYEDILFFNEDRSETHYLTRQDVLSCELHFDDYNTRPAICRARPYRKDCFFIPKSLMIKKTMNLDKFINSVLERLSSK